MTNIRIAQDNTRDRKHLDEVLNYIDLVPLIKKKTKYSDGSQIKSFIIDMVFNIDTSININTFEQLGLNTNKENFDFVFDRIKKLEYYQKDIVEYNRNFFNLLYYDKDNIEGRIETFITYIHTGSNSGSYWPSRTYETLFTKEQMNSYDFVSKLIELDPYTAGVVFNGIEDPNVRKKIIDKYYTEIYKHGRNYLIGEEKEEIIRKVLISKSTYLSKDNKMYRTPIVDIMYFHNSKLLDKLKNKFGKAYVEKTGNPLHDDIKFMYTMLTSNVLDSIYTNSSYDNDDITVVKNIINYFDDIKKDTKPIKARIEYIKRTYGQFERDMYNFIVLNKDNTAKLDEYLTKHNINKDNFSMYIRGRKFIDNKMKEAILLILSKHYKADYISVYDILQMIQISQEKEIDLEKVLENNNINIKKFNAILDKIKNEQPGVYEIINQSKAKYNSKYKKLIRYYNDIKSNQYNSYDKFVERFKKTPEEILDLFVDTTLFDEVHDEILKWYDFKHYDDKKPGSRK